MKLHCIRLCTAFSIIILAACKPITSPTPAPPSAATTCESLDSLTLGQQITVTAPPGNSFQPPSMDIAAHPFTWSSGTTTSNGFARVEDGMLAGGSGREINVNNILLSISIGFGQTLQKAQLSFGEYGGNLNVSINDEFVNFNNFNDIAGTTIGGVTVNLLSGGNGNDMGVIEFTGNMIDQSAGLGQFSVGGQELYIDDICVTP
jgi:hypothetical protein